MSNNYANDETLFNKTENNEQEIAGEINNHYAPKNETPTTRSGCTKPLLLASITSTLGLALPVGYHHGVINTPATVIQKFCNESALTRYNITLTNPEMNILWSSIVSIYLVGATVGSLGGSLLADKIGRKGVFMLCYALAILSSLLFLGTKRFNSLEMLLAARLSIGLSAGLITSVSPMYLTELAPLHLRGPTGALCPLGVTIGVLFGQILSMNGILGNSTYWPLCLAFFLVPLLPCAATVTLLPESPKYLYVIKQKRQLAIKLLKQIRNTEEEDLKDEIDEWEIENRDNFRSEHWSLKKVLNDKNLLLPVLLVCSLQAGQQLSGINAVFYYSSSIFEAAGLSKKASELAVIGTGVCNLAMAVLSVLITKKFDRRTCVQISILSSAFFLVLLGISIMYIKSNSWIPYLSIVGVLGYVICYGLGLGPIPYFIGSELFEVGPKPSAMALGSMSNWGANCIIALTFPTMQASIGSSSFFIFVAFVLVLFVFVRLYLPETRGKDSNTIAQLVQDGFSSKPLLPKTLPS